MLKNASTPLISVIILNYNGKNYLDNCIDSVLKTSYPNFEIILVDNASTDNSLKNIKKKFGKNTSLKIIENSDNLGFSGGNNIGYSFSKGEYVTFLNNDTIVDPDWLSTLYDAMKEDETIGLAQSIIYNIDGEKIQQGGWIYSNYLLRMSGLLQNWHSISGFKPTFEVSVASGASMMTKRGLIEKMGLFDASMPFFYDDTLLSFKMWLVNKRVVTVSNSKIRHIGGATSAWTTQLVNYNLVKARFCLIFNIYYKKSELVKAVFVNVLSMVLGSFFSLKEKNLALPLGFFQALVWSIKRFGYLWGGRLYYWSRNKVPPKILKDKMIRISLPSALYIAPTKRANEYFKSEFEIYEKKLVFK
ncbi:MAG: glycosyltransferase family 2 protein [Candidatus Bathyarchaeota archaeon]|nr:glycosyltransferase family 2 protein [Candidatus Bathyarchaeota archaeon]